MNTLTNLIIKRQEGQNTSNVRREGIVAIYSESLLPSMKAVTDWKVSGTGQWAKNELSVIQETDAEDLGRQLAKNQDSWISMGVIAELSLHGENDRAIKVAQTLFKLDPDASQHLSSLFGQDVIDCLSA